MLEAKQVTKQYTVKKKTGFLKSQKQTVEAVRGIDLKINRGEIIGLLGLNGAGKTTTIKMLSTLLNPSSGSITIDGADIVQQAKALKHKVNMIAGGERMLYFRLTGRENLEYFGRLYGYKGKELQGKIVSLLEQVGLEDAADLPVERYSKGMKQRLQIARGLINDPDYLFLDEPTLGLDAPIARKLRETVRTFAKQYNKGILLTSHYLEEVEELCDRVYIIDQGKVVMHDTPKRIIEAVVHEYHAEVLTTVLDESVQRLLQKKALEKSIRLSFKSDLDATICHAVSPFDPTQAFLHILIQEGIPISSFEAKRPSLEDAIMELAKERSA